MVLIIKNKITLVLYDSHVFVLVKNEWWWKGERQYRQAVIWYWERERESHEFMSQNVGGDIDWCFITLE